MRASFFPLGDIQSDDDSDRIESVWRQTKFISLELTTHLIPKIPLSTVVKQWKKIKNELAESPRKRKLQVDKLFFLS